MRFNFAWGIALLSVLISSNIASATSCAPPSDDIIKSYPIIFKGKAISTTELPLENAVAPSLVDKLLHSEEDVLNAKLWVGDFTVTKFDVQEVYKGQIGKEIDVYHFNAGTTYQDGLSYVIFTGQDLNTNDGIEDRIETGMCSPRIFLEEKDVGPLMDYAPDIKRQLETYNLEKNSKTETVR